MSDVRLRSQDAPLNVQELFYQQAYEQAAEQPEQRAAPTAPGERRHVLRDWLRSVTGKI